MIWGKMQTFVEIFYLHMLENEHLVTVSWKMSSNFNNWIFKWNVKSYWENVVNGIKAFCTRSKVAQTGYLLINENNVNGMHSKWMFALAVSSMPMAI